MAYGTIDLTDDVISHLANNSINFIKVDAPEVNIMKNDGNKETVYITTRTGPRLELSNEKTQDVVVDESSSQIANTLTNSHPNGGTFLIKNVSGTVAINEQTFEPMILTKIRYAYVDDVLTIDDIITMTE